MNVPGESTRTVTARRLPVNGVVLACFDWAGADPAVLFAHATGFHARCWDQVIALLPGRHCIAVDLRGHGRSEKPPPPYPWTLMGVDLAEAARLLGLRGALGVGHSSGGYAITVAAARAQGSFGALLLLDPTISPRGQHGGKPPPSQFGFALKRRNEWSSPEEMFERFTGRHPYSLWQPAVLRDYCEYGLLPAANGDGYVLACPPWVEDAVYAGGRMDDIYPVVETLDLPVRILRARPRAERSAGGPVDMSASPTPPDLASHFPRGTDVSLPYLTHFIPMQAPDLVAQQVQQMLHDLETSVR
jgi:lipase